MGKSVSSSCIGVLVRVRNSIAADRAAAGHTVRFFDSDESRAEGVALFLAQGYRAGEALIVMARPRIWAEIHNQLSRVDVPVASTIADNRLVVLDAAETLRKISVGHRLGARQFDNVVGTLVRTAARDRGVRAYGAMVDVLAQRGDFGVAIDLENHWNALSRQTRLRLLCGYCSAHFVADESQSSLSAICAAHERVEMESQDQLGVWLLGNAGLQPSLG